MKKMLSVFFMCFFIAGMAYAGEKTWNEQKHKKHGYKNPVVVKAIGFSAKYSDGRVITQWKSYLRNDFKMYKLVKSSRNKNPFYPEDSYIFYSPDREANHFEDRKEEEGIWYYRLCIITKNRDRWVSPVVRIKIDSMSSVPTAKDFK